MERRRFLGATAAGSAGCMLGNGLRASFKGKPNIVLIMADDMGYGDLGCFGSELIETPVIDNMADEGIKLTSFYSCASICAPSRSGIITGRYPIRNGVTMNFYSSQNPARSIPMQTLSGIGWGMDTDEITLADALKPRGYECGCIGKWHLGDLKRYRPHRRGFDYFFGVLFSNGMKPFKLFRMDEVVEYPVDQDRLTQRYTEEAISFIEKNRDRPFFLYLPHTFPHIPLHASSEFRGSSRGGLYGDCVEEIDWSTGQVLSALSRLGLSEDTLVIFTSDNGPFYEGSTGGHRGRKNQPFEGGMRVPFIARWPGVIPAGQVSKEMSMNFDLFTTVLEAAGAPIPGDRVIDGKDMLPLLKGGQSRHDALLFYWLDNLHAVRKGRWKYHRQHRFWASSFFFAKRGPMLFDVEGDPHESYNLIDLYPEKARELEVLMNDWEARLEKEEKR